MRRIVLIVLLLIGAFEDANASDKTCPKTHSALNGEAKKRLNASRDLDRFLEDLTWFKVELECHTLRRANVSKQQKRIRFLANLQMGIVDALDPKTLSLNNCEERILEVRSNTSGTMFADGEYSAYIDWITEAAEKVCLGRPSVQSTKQDRTPAKK